MTTEPPIFDGHNDFLLRLLREPATREATWIDGTAQGHLDLPRMRAGGFGGGFFAIYIPSDDAPDLSADMETPPYRLPLPNLIDSEAAQPVAWKMVGHLRWMERASAGGFKLCTTVAEIRACMADGTIAAILHLEGAEPIADDLDALHLWHSMGLRSLGPVWSRPTAFGHGVPFAYPSSPDTGDGLTGVGKDLVRECNRLGIMVDLSHLNEKGFDDVARISDAPLVATHSNAHAVTASSRNLTDRQLDVIRDSDGMVGVNFAVGFLNLDGTRRTDTGFDPMLRHLDHLIERLGEGRVGFGSDFDGAQIPEAMHDVAGLPKLRDALAAHGYDAALMERLCNGNWLALLARTWHDPR